MWTETKIAKIEILPDWTIQIDFIESWENHRCFVSNSDFFSMYWKAIELHWKQVWEYRQRKQLENYISSWEEWEVFNEDWSVFTIEEAKKELNELKEKSSINYDVFKMYIEWERF